MDATLARRALLDLATATDRGVLLWRGDDLTGNDVDLVVLPGRAAALAEHLRGTGFSPAPQDPGRVLWRLLPDHAVVLDVLEAPAWPAFYPPLDGLLARADEGPGGLPVASAGDRVLVHAAEALAGYPREKTARKLAAARAVPGARDAAAAVDTALACSGRLGALRSARGRAALAARLRDALGLRERIAVPRDAPRPGVLIALSGMDGAGKSTAALELQGMLEAAQRPTVLLWMRLAGDLRTINRVARLVRRVLRRGATRSEPPANAPQHGFALPSAPVSRGRLIDAVWPLLVVAVSVRGMRQAARLSRRGLGVVCDRWVLDSLVDLELRYGRRRAASWLLRRATPRADLALLLDIDAETAAARKPGDQPGEVLGHMARRYPALAESVDGLVRIDARGGLDDVLAAVREAAAVSAGPATAAAAPARAPRRTRA